MEIRCFLQPGLDRLLGKLPGGQIPERAMRPVHIVIDSPRFDDGLRLGE